MTFSREGAKREEEKRVGRREGWRCSFCQGSSSDYSIVYIIQDVEMYHESTLYMRYLTGSEAMFNSYIS